MHYHAPHDDDGFVFRDGLMYWKSGGQRVVARAWPSPRLWVRRKCAVRRNRYEQKPKAYDPGDMLLGKAETVLFQSTCLADCLPVMDDEARGQMLLEGFSTGDRARDVEIHEIRVCWRDREAIRQFWDTIPPEIGCEVRKYPYLCWPVLECLSSPSSMDLSRSNPKLFHMLVEKLYADPSAKIRPHAAVNDWAGRMQTEIMQFLGIPGTESNRKILRKVTVSGLADIDCAVFTELDQHPEIRRTLEHIPVLNEGILLLLQGEASYSHLSGPLLHELSAMESSSSMAFYFEVFGDAEALLDDENMHDRKLYSVRHAKQVHHELMSRQWAKNKLTDTFRNMTFPAPPFKGTDAIIPLTKPEDLFCEGTEMRHCVAVYAKRIAAGTTYIYRVLEPLRATLEICRNKDGSWTPGQLAGKHNACVSEDLKQKLFSHLIETPNKATRNDHPHSAEHEMIGQLPLVEPQMLEVVQRAIRAFGPVTQNGDAEIVNGLAADH